MSWYSIHHACGHDRDVQLYGTSVHGERERAAARLATQPCPACARDGRDQRAAEATAHLPALTGTDKQIQWATTLRAEAVAQLDRLRDRCATIVAADSTRPAAVEATAILAALDEVLADITDSTWWIEHRDGSAQAIKDRIREPVRQRLGR